MRRLLPILSLAAAALALTAAPAAARSNPYSPERVCGAGYSRVTHNPLTATSNQRVTIATAYLLYSRYTGKNCAVTLKARSIGKPTYTTAVIKKRGTGNPYDAKVDHGYFSYFAGPVYVHAPQTCVRYGATVSVPKPRTPGRIVYFRSFYSGWVGCH